MDELMFMAMMGMVLDDVAKSNDTSTEKVLKDFLAFSNTINELIKEGMDEDDAIKAVSRAWNPKF